LRDRTANQIGAFAHVARAIGVAPQRIAFFDDTAENVAWAVRAGFSAFHVRSTAQLGAALGLSP
jgi:putative hydrolase of the HAD superfamily